MSFEIGHLQFILNKKMAAIISTNQDVEVT